MNKKTIDARVQEVIECIKGWRKNDDRNYSLKLEKDTIWKGGSVLTCTFDIGDYFSLDKNTFQKLNEKNFVSYHVLFDGDYEKLALPNDKELMLKYKGNRGRYINMRMSLEVHLTKEGKKRNLDNKELPKLKKKAEEKW